MTTFSESVVEQAALAWLESVGWLLHHGAEIAPGEPAAERFGRFIKPLFARSISATTDSGTLAALRDALLPKLVSGELRVKHTTRYVEATL